MLTQTSFETKSKSVATVKRIIKTKHKQPALRCQNNARRADKKQHPNRQSQTQREIRIYLTHQYGKVVPERNIATKMCLIAGQKQAADFVTAKSLKDR